MAEQGLVFQFRYGEMECYPNVWTENVLEDGALWSVSDNKFQPYIHVEGGTKGLLDINDPAYQTAPEMPGTERVRADRKGTPGQRRVC